MNMKTNYPGKNRGKSKKRWLFWLILVGALAILAFYYLNGFLRDEQPKMMTFTARKGDIEETVLATGVLKPAKLVAVGAQASGRIISLHAKTGQIVKKDDLIAQIDSVNQQNDLRKEKAALVSNQAQRAEKVSNLLLAQQILERQKQMIARNASSKEDYEKAVNSVKSAEAQIAYSDAQIIQAQIAVDIAQANLGYTQIRAPIDGTVLATVVQEGQTVNALQSAPTIAIIGQLDKMTVETDISEADILKVHTGQDLYFTISGQSSKKYTAKLQNVDPAPQSIVSDKSFNASSAASSSAASASAIYYNGIFSVDNPDSILRTYMTAEVHIILGSAKDAVLVPSAAVNTPGESGKSFVNLVKPDGSISPQSVETGLNDKVMVEIISGLNAGDVVVNGALPDSTAAAGAQRSQRGRSIRF